MNQRECMEVQSPGDLQSFVANCIQLYFSGDIRGGLDASSEALSHARRLGDLRNLRRLLMVHGIFQSDLHNLPQAFECFSEALDICDALEDPRHSFPVWHNLGVALLYSEFPRLAMLATKGSFEHARRVS